MSLEPVITPVPSGARVRRRRRNLEERVLARFPGLFARQAAVAQRVLSARSPVRRRLLRRAIASGYAAFRREDFDLMLVRYAPDVRFELPPGLDTLGLGVFQGHDGVIEGLRKLVEVWETFDLEPAYVIDIGDRALVLNVNHSRARASGVSLDTEFAHLVTAGPHGLVVRDQAFFSWEEGIRAAGLDPEKIELPAR